VAQHDADRLQLFSLAAVAPSQPDRSPARSSSSIYALISSPPYPFIRVYYLYLPSCGMDPLSATASIIAILQLSGKVLAYLNDVKDAPKDRTQCAVEMLNLCSLLYKLRDHVEKGDPTQLWYTAVQDLAVKNGPLDQFKQALETLQTKITDGNRLRRAGEALMWKFKKEEIASILGQIERLKSLIEIALQMDHL
jgi:hypothetical protein